MMLHTTRAIAPLAIAGFGSLSLFAAPSAQAIALYNSYGYWTNTTGGSNVAAYNLQGGTYYSGQYGSGENQVRWGVPASGSPQSHIFQSGLGFRGVGGQAIALGNPFSLGTLRHFNNPVFSGTWASSASLSLRLNFAEFGARDFSFTFNIDETSNGGYCPYYSVRPCSDRITWNNASLQQFSWGGRRYSLELTGFSMNRENPTFLISEGLLETQL